MAGEEKPETGGSTERILRCSKCGKITDCSSDDLMNYMRAGWPKCCGDVMTLFIEAKLPGSAES
jgi:hypothetical protein